MKAVVSILALITGFVLAGSLVQRHRNSGLQQQLAALAQEKEAQAGQLQTLETARKQVETERDDLLMNAAFMQEHARTQQLANPPTTPRVSPAATETNTDVQRAEKAGLGNFLSKMMQDPDAKKFIRDQQRAMLDQMYAPLLKRLNLSPDEAAQFKDMIADNAMNAAEKATAMFSATNRSDLAASLSVEQKAFDEQLKTFLGEERFAKFQEYQETVGDRTQLNLFKQQSGGDYPINETQTEQLLTLIKEERRSVSAETGQSAVPSPKNQQNLEAMLSPEHAEKLLQSQEIVNQRVFERARGILSPEQLQSFGAFQSNQMQTMRLGMSMARKLLAPDTPQGAVAEGSR